MAGPARLCRRDHCEAHQISKSIEIIQSNANLSHYSNFASAKHHTECIYKRILDTRRWRRGHWGRMARGAVRLSEMQFTWKMNSKSDPRRSSHHTRLLQRENAYPLSFILLLPNNFSSNRRIKREKKNSANASQQLDRVYACAHTRYTHSRKSY